jgi:hypothetical protein
MAAKSGNICRVWAGSVVLAAASSVPSYILPHSLSGLGLAVVVEALYWCATRAVG